MWIGASVGVLLVVRDLDRSVRFYTDGLGGVVETRWDTYALIRLAGAAIHVATPGDPTPDKPQVSLVAPDPRYATGEVVISVPDCRATHSALVTRGVDFLAPPYEPPWGGEVRCFIQDPDGHLIEISQVDAAHQ